MRVGVLGGAAVAVAAVVTYTAAWFLNGGGVPGGGPVPHPAVKTLTVDVDERSPWTPVDVDHKNRGTFHESAAPAATAVEQMDTYTRDEMMHVVVLALGTDKARIDAFNLARSILLASDPSEHAITIHILSDRWAGESNARATDGMMHDHRCASEAAALLSTRAGATGTAGRIRLHTLPSSFADAAVLNASGFSWHGWAQHHGRTNRDAYHKPEVLFWKLVLPLLLPNEVERAVLMDADIFVAGDLRDLWATFGRFRPRQLFAMAIEQTPGYADCFEHVGADESSGWTAAVEAQRIPLLPRYGFPGFNSGVSLIHVARLKESREFMGLLTSPDTVFKLMAAMRENDQEAANMREYSSAEFGTATAELNATIAEARNATGDARKELSRRILAMFSEGRDGKIERFKATHGPGWTRRINACTINGVLGDQDVLNAAATEYPWMFGVVPCEWNKQLCRAHVRRGSSHDGSRAANWTAGFQCRGAGTQSDESARGALSAKGPARRPSWRAAHNNCDFKPWGSVFNRAMRSPELCKFKDEFHTGEPDPEPIVLDPGSQLPRCQAADPTGWAPIELAVRTAKQACVKMCMDLRHPRAVTMATEEGQPCAEWDCSCQGASDKYSISRGDFGSAKRNEAVKQFWMSHNCTTMPASDYAEMCGGVESSAS